MNPKSAYKRFCRQSSYASLPLALKPPNQSDEIANLTSALVAL